MKSGKWLQWTAVWITTCVAMHAQAAEAQPGGIQVEQCWVRAMPSTVPSAGYFTLHNTGEAPRTLTAVATPAFGMAMMHRSESNGSMSMMEPVSSVRVPAHGSVSFAPKGYHVMLEEPVQPLKVGGTLPLTLSFDDGSTLTAQCAIKSPATMGQAAP